MNLSNEDPPIVAVKDLSLAFTDGKVPLEALKGIDFEVAPEQFVCIIGPSGSGKSTLLRILAGLLSPTCGEVMIEGKKVEGTVEGIGMVFQDANLMPWRTVLENILLPLEIDRNCLLSKEEKEQRAEELIDLVGLTGFRDWLPRDLSGGMAQRVAIARSLIHDPKLLLLDEPFGSLDALTRERMGGELLRIWRAQKKTVVMVTHDIAEAVFLGDRVLAFSPQPGRLRVDLNVDLPRPREEGERYSSRFIELTHQLRDAIR
ncbi:MAG: ABC transporter ATP-binding protein [Anaerolineales bacterium]